MIDGVVRQLLDGVGTVVSCTASSVCYVANGCPQFKVTNKQCQLSVPEHGNRCCAWETDVTKWIIDIDMNKIKQLP